MRADIFYNCISFTQNWYKVDIQNIQHLLNEWQNDEY